MGARLAASLEKRGHSVSVIDQDSEAFRRLGDDFSGRKIKGVGFDRDVLVESGIETADGFAAVSSGDNSNILAARVVREFFDVSNVVARIYDPGRAEVYERLGIPTVAPVRWAADKVLRRLLPDGSEPVWRDQAGEVGLIEVFVHPDWVGHTVGRMQEATRTPIPFLLRVGLGVVPRPDTIFQDGDLAYAAVETHRIGEVETVLGAPPRRH